MTSIELVSFKLPREQIPAVSHVKSTLLSSSLRALRERGLFEAYIARLPREHHDEVLSSVAGAWHDLEVASAHYEACDRLGLSEAKQLELGQHVGARLHSTLMGLVTRMASDAGATPWLPLGQCSAFFERVYQGGGVSLTQLGPKEARVEMVGVSLARIDYFRVAKRGIIQAACQLFCKKSVVVEEPQLRRLVYRVSWV
jgi:hypothetical protein